MWASPQARAAAFDQDPFAGLIELWVLAIQQRKFFTEGLGESYFGDARTCAMTELDRQLASTSAKLESVGKGLIDHFFVRLVEVLLVMGVVVFLIVVLVLLVARKPSPRDN